ncbi:MAG: extracellular solute-binding protein [Azospirillaceae bacterium]
MTKGEMLAVLGFVERSRSPLRDDLGLAEPDPIWRMVVFLVRQHLDAKRVTITSLADASGAPYGTAMRRIREMMTEGLIERHPYSRTGRSFSLHPSDALMARVERYAEDIKRLVGEAIGARAEATTATEDFHFGRSYIAARIIPRPVPPVEPPFPGHTVRMLAYVDPVFVIISGMRTQLVEMTGITFEIEPFKIERLREKTLENAGHPVSRVDVLAIDFPWIGEYCANGLLHPLDDLIAGSGMNRFDFHGASWEAGTVKGIQYGIPIQPTADLLWYRKDLFQVSGLAPPVDVEGVLHAARNLHRPVVDLNGIAFSAARGTPLANTFIQVMGAFGRPPFNLRRVGAHYDLSDLSGEDLRPMIDSDEGLQTATYLKELVRFSPPGILSMAWDDCALAYADGAVAMCYNWSCRAGLFEMDPRSPARRNTGFLPHPAGRRGRSWSPIGGSLLGIPANIDPERIEPAWALIERLTSPELMKIYVENGSTVSTRFSVSADPDVAAASPIIGVVDRLARAGQLQTWQRPPVPEFADVIAVIGSEIHDMLRGEITPRESVQRAQGRADAIMRAHGRY